VDDLGGKRESTVRKELDELVNRTSGFLAHLAEGGYGRSTDGVGNALVQQRHELRKGSLGTGPHVAQNRGRFLLRKRVRRFVEKLTFECLDEGVTYLKGSGGPLLLIVMSQGLKGFSPHGSIAVI
jgi:hypothetical protein